VKMRIFKLNGYMLSGRDDSFINIIFREY
jgi:hypothetical protein